MNRRKALTEEKRLFHEGRFDECITLLERILESKPGNQMLITCLLRKSECLQKLQQWDDAYVVLKRALREGRTDMHVLICLSDYYSECGLPEKQQRYLRRAARLHPKAATPRYNLGLCYLQMERPESALRELDAALRLDPTDRRVLEQVAELVHDACMWTRSIRVSTSLARRDRGDYFARANIAEAHLRLGNPEHALKYIDRALTIDKSWAFLHLLRARIVYALGRDDEAEQSLKKAYRLERCWIVKQKTVVCFNRLRNRRWFRKTVIEGVKQEAAPS